MKILITGINGQVGSALVRHTKAQGHEVIAISREQWDMELSPEYGEELVVKSKPDLVINPAAFTNVDSAENDEAVALKVNADAPRALAKGCQQLKIPLFHISTDYVFDGDKEEPYVETDKTNPINAYGRTKLAVELAVQEETQNYIILRTSWVFSKIGTNSVTTMRRLGKERDELKIVHDQCGGPTSADCIANVLMSIASQYLKGEDIPWGTYHYAGSPVVSWYEFAEAILKAEDKVYKSKLTPCASTEYPTKAVRPKNSALSIARIQREMGVLECNWVAELRS